MADHRLYYADSKHTVRHKLGLAKDESDEDFDKFQVALPNTFILTHH